MKESFLSIFRCVVCEESQADSSGPRWDLKVDYQDDREIREGTLRCLSCQTVYPIHKGILNTLRELPKEVAHEKEHAESLGYIETQDGEKHPINEETIHQFRRLLLALPAGDGSMHFKPGGSFDNQAGNAERFFKTLEMLRLKKGDSVLEVGASFGWGSRRFAQRGCDVVALDVTHYLMAADLYFDEDGSYYERLMGDMSRLPFCDNSFDIIFSHSVIHHCQNLGKLFSEFHRVLKPGGRVVALHECAFGIFEDKSGKALQEAIDEGFNENAYTLPQWKKGAQKGGFRKVKFHFFSFVDDYIYRKELRGTRRTKKLRLARWIKSRPRLNAFLNQMSILPRILFRPKAWMIIAIK